MGVTLGRQGSSTAVIPRHIAALDGLRAFAILAVLFHHSGEYYLMSATPTRFGLTSWIENLGSGVDLFFALSGFLITGILLDSLRQPYFFQRFYWRRGLRIWPLYYVFLVAAYLVHHGVFSGIGVAPFVFYYRNFLRPDHTSDIYVGQFWSLCVEEQFYLVWPLVLFVTPKRMRMPLILLLIVMALCFRIYLFSRGADPYVIYRLPFCHMDVLLGGAAVAVLIRNGIKISTLRNLSWGAIALGIAGLAVEQVSQPTIAILSIRLTCFALLCGGMVGACAKPHGGNAGAILASPFLEAISRRSYAMYVFHLVPLYASYNLLLHWRLFPLRMLPVLLVILAVGLVTYGLAWLSWKYLESPILRWKNWEWFARKSSDVAR